MSLYEIILLGCPTADDVTTLRGTLDRTLAQCDLAVDREVVLRRFGDLHLRDPKAASVVVFFAAPNAPDAEAAAALMSQGVPVIPTIGHDAGFGLVPAGIAAANGLQRRVDDVDLEELSAAALECLGLLRRQRRTFVSYRRIESRAAAHQLHDLLAARGFDVFLDTHDIRPGEIFQEVLWHRLCDSDVLVMLDTPSYFDSRWTREEFGRAGAKGIHVLRVIWPDHTPTRVTDLAESIHLQAAELEEPAGPIVNSTAERIVLAVEKLRSRSLASRHLSMVGRLRAEVEAIGGAVIGVGAHRALKLDLPGDREAWAYPVIGVPTAELLHDVAEKARRAGHGGPPFLVYDALGIRRQWTQHLEWLQANITSVRWVKIAEAGWTLAEEA